MKEEVDVSLPIDNMELTLHMWLQTAVTSFK